MKSLSAAIVVVAGSLMVAVGSLSADMVFAHNGHRGTAFGEMVACAGGLMAAIGFVAWLIDFLKSDERKNS